MADRAAGVTAGPGVGEADDRPAILLLGDSARRLADRLEASGYRPLLELAPEASPPAASPAPSPLAAPPELPQSRPALVLLAASEAARIPELRRRFGPVPLLLDVEQDDLEARVRCLSSGADDYWLSGLGASDLLMRLRLQLRLSRRVHAATALLQVGDLVVNPLLRQVRRGSRLVALTAREYQLLLLLLERQGTVVSREQILRHVWNEPQGVASNVIEVYVRYLRQKLEEGGERRLIHTVRGQGYCLSERLPPTGPPAPLLRP